MRALLVPVTGLLLGAALAGVSDLLPSFIVDNFEELIKAAAATCEVLPLDVIFSRQTTPELRHLELVQFTRGRGQRRYRARDAPRLLASQRASGSPLLLYVPGWWNTPSDESSTALVQALLHRHPSVLLLDTRLSFCRGYVGSASRVNSLANLLYKLIYKLVGRGVPLESIHLIGFSLGAHVVGMTGRLVQRNMNRKLERITALDPAKPCFARSSKFRLSRRDAEFVQVIHTSTGVLGLEQPVGHADVYMNGVPGRQPECRDTRISLECDHSQAWKLYAASVMNASSLRGRRCRSWDELRSGTCAGDEAVLGWGCRQDTKGMFLHTSEAARRTSSLQYKEVEVFNPFDPFSWFSK